MVTKQIQLSFIYDTKKGYYTESNTKYTLVLISVAVSY